MITPLKYQKPNYKNLPQILLAAEKLKEKTKNKRKKVNFMFDNDVIIKLSVWIPPGERSEFVNNALNEALKDYARHEASRFMGEFREKYKIKMSDEEIRKAREYGRE